MEESVAMTWGYVPWIAGNAPHHGHQVAGFPRQELCEEKQGLQSGGDSASVYQPCGHPLPSEGVASTDCVRLPGNISSFLFVKAHNLQSDISSHDFKRHFNQQLETTSYTHLNNSTLLAPPTCLHATGEVAKELHADSVRATGNVAIPQGHNEDPGLELPDTTILPNTQDFCGPRRGSCDQWS